MKPYEKILETIGKAIDKYSFDYSKVPNAVFLGPEIKQELMSSLTKTEEGQNKNQIFGIDIYPADFGYIGVGHVTIERFKL